MGVSDGGEVGNLFLVCVFVCVRACVCVLPLARVRSESLVLFLTLRVMVLAVAVAVVFCFESLLIFFSCFFLCNLFSTPVRWNKGNS